MTAKYSVYLVYIFQNNVEAHFDFMSTNNLFDRFVLARVHPTSARYNSCSEPLFV